MKCPNCLIDGKDHADLLQVAEGALGYLQALPPRYAPDPEWQMPLIHAIAKNRGRGNCLDGLAAVQAGAGRLLKAVEDA